MYVCIYLKSNDNNLLVLPTDGSAVGLIRKRIQNISGYKIPKIQHNSMTKQKKVPAIKGTNNNNAKKLTTTATQNKNVNNLM